MPRLRSPSLSLLSSYALSACSLSGRWRGRPRLPRTGGIASTVASSSLPSGTFAPERVVASGKPFLLVHYLMALGTRLASVHRRRTDRLTLSPPFFAPLARTLTESALARLQSIRSALSKRASKIPCRRCQTPALCQSRKRLQQVMPEPQPISCGSISHGMPLLRTNRMPVRTERSGAGGRPRLPGCTRWGGSSGSTTVQSSSLTSSRAIPGKYPRCHFC